MENFAYVNAADVEQASSLLSDDWSETKMIAGGTDLLGELKEYIETPKKVVNLKSIPGLDEIKADASGLNHRCARNARRHRCTSNRSIPLYRSGRGC